MRLTHRTLKEQKEQKKEDLLHAAYSCFLEKGFAKTTIDEIVQRAKVAKGTFYLYFSDKEDLMDHLVLQISYHIVIEAYRKTKEKEYGSFLPSVLAFVDLIIEYFKANKAVLKLIERNFSWPLALSQIDAAKDDDIREILNDLLHNPTMSRYSEEEAFRIVYMIVELVGSVCYSSIIERQPDTIDHLKPTLYRMIEKILS